MALVGKAGIDRRQIPGHLPPPCSTAHPVFHTYGGLIADQRFEPAGFAHRSVWDVRLVLAAGEASRVPLPLASLLRDRFLALLAQGGDKLDWSAIGMLAAKDAGVS